MTQTPEVPRSANQDFDILLDTVQKHVGDVYQTAVLEQGMGAIFRVGHNNVGKPYIDYCDPSHVLTEAVGSCQPVSDLSAASTAVAVKLRAELGLAGAAAVGFFGQAQRDNIDDFDKKCTYYFPGTGNATKYLAERLLNVFANHHSEIDEKTAQGVAELYLLLGRHGWSDKQVITPEGVQTPLPDHDTYKLGLLLSLRAWAKEQSGLPGLQSALCELERNILGRDLVGYGRADGVSKRTKGGPSIGSSLRVPKLAAAALVTGFGLTVAASPSAAAETTAFSPTNILPPQPGEVWSVTLPTQASAASVSQSGLGGSAVPFQPAIGGTNVLQALKSVPIAEKLRPDEGADSPTQLVADNLGTTAVLGGGVKPPEQRRVPASSNSETTTAPVETPTAKSAFAQSIEQRMKQLEVAETAQTATPASAGKYRTLIEQILRNPTVVQNFSDPQKNQILTGENTPNSDIFVQMVGLKLAQLNNGTEPGANGYTSDAQQIITALLLRYELLVQPESDAMRQLISQAQELAKQQQGATETSPAIPSPAAEQLTVNRAELRNLLQTANPDMSPEKLDFITNIGALIVEQRLQGREGNEQIIMGQAILESNWGDSGLSSQYNNFHGLKAGSTWQGATTPGLSTKEEENGKMIDIKDSFRAYASPAEGIAGYFDFISTDRYAEARSHADDPRAFIQALKDAGYATDSKYVAKVLGIVEANHLEVISSYYIQLKEQNATPSPAAQPPSEQESNINSEAGARALAERLAAKYPDMGIEYGGPQDGYVKNEKFTVYTVTIEDRLVGVEIAEGLADMLIAARNDGVSLGIGNSFRTMEGQIEARKANGCPDIYTAKSSSCDTPTARPGYSNHQGGRAVDLVIDKGSGVLIKRGTPQDKWLKENAEKYGLTNLPSEAWHYSTNGN